MAPPVDPGILEKAKAIVAEYTPQSAVTVEAFQSGLRVVGVTIPDAWKAESGAMRVETTLPAWINRAELLGVADLHMPLNVRLLWTKEPGATPRPEVFRLRIVEHHAFTRQMQNNQTALDPADHAYGDVFWSDHQFPAMNVYPTGLYNLLISNGASPVETVPLGQILVPPVPQAQSDGAERLKGVFPDGHILSTDYVVLSPWFGVRMTGIEAPFRPRAVAIISSADWIEELPNKTALADVVLTDKNGKESIQTMELGRDTASTWYNYHVRGNIKHDIAPVAWSWQETVETVNFEANVYIGRFEVGDDFGQLDSVRVTYAGESGLLRVRGMVLLP